MSISRCSLGLFGLRLERITVVSNYIDPRLWLKGVSPQCATPCLVFRLHSHRMQVCSLKTSLHNASLNSAMISSSLYSTTPPIKAITRAHSQTLRAAQTGSSSSALRHDAMSATASHRILDDMCMSNFSPDASPAVARVGLRATTAGFPASELIL